MMSADGVTWYASAGDACDKTSQHTVALPRRHRAGEPPLAAYTSRPLRPRPAIRSCPHTHAPLDHVVQEPDRVSVARAVERHGGRVGSSVATAHIAAVHCIRITESRLGRAGDRAASAAYGQRATPD